MSNNLLIVESGNDKLFIERLRCELNDANFDIEPPICNITDFECLNGLSPKKLENKLREISFDISKRNLSKIGILLDANAQGIAKRIGLVNQAAQTLDKALDISAPNTWYASQALGVEFSCHILNLNGYGELETLLKTIKNQPSLYADCLDAWRICLNNGQLTVSDKDFDKFWVSVYQRYDGCNRKDRKQAGEKCNFAASLEKDLWDFSHPALNELKSYLLTFT